MDAPIPFVTFKADKFNVHEDAARVLSSLDGPLGVVAVAGLYRTGKSYILNRLAGRSHGFSIGSSVEPCTEGIWMWIVPAQQVAKLGQTSHPMSLVLIDTEGIGSYSKSKTYDVQVFALAVLLSSYFIYNSMGSIDENAMDRLSLVVELTKHIRTQADNKDEDGHELSRFFPKFLWLVRDFSLKLIMEGREITSNEYLENALKPLQGDAAKVKTKNLIRSSIAQFFPDRACFTLRRPVSDEAQLQHLEKVPESELRPQFVEQIQELLKLIYQSIRPKQLFGEQLNGRMFVELTRSYVTAINNGGVPIIHSAWDSVVEVECTRAVDAGLAAYEERLSTAFDENDILEVDDLWSNHLQARDAAFVIFNSIARGSKPDSYKKKLEESISKAFEAQQAGNSDRSTKTCEKLFASAREAVDANIAITDETGKPVLSSIEELEMLWRDAIARFYPPDQAKGPQRYRVLSVGLERAAPEQASRIGRHISQKLSAQKEKELDDQRKAMEEERRKIQNLYDDVKESWGRSRDQVRDLEKENLELINVIANLSKAIE